MTHLITGNKFDPNTDIPDLTDKVYIVTGGSAGIGFGIVAHLLQHNASKIYILSMKEEHIQEAMEALREFLPAGSTKRVEDIVEWKQCNLESFKQTDSTAKELEATLTKLDGLMLNAGLGVGVYNETGDGVDSHMQVNHFSQFHLALTLLPLLQRTPDSRLVLQSSELHRSAPSDVAFRSLDEINRDIGPSYLYNRTKLAMILFVRALVKRKRDGHLGFDEFGGSAPWVNATHPGGVRTDQQKQAEDAYGTLGKIGVAAVRPFMKDPVDEGCRPALFALTSPDIVKEKIDGQYLVPDRKVTSPSSQAQNDELAENLWKLSEQVLAEKIGSLPYRTQYVDPMGREGIHGDAGQAR